MKIPKQLQQVITNVKKRKMTGFIYNLNNETRKLLLDSEKDILYIDAQDVRTKGYMLNKIGIDLDINHEYRQNNQIALKIKIQQRIKNKFVVIDNVEFLALNGYKGISELTEMSIPVLCISTYSDYKTQLRKNKFYQTNIIIEFDSNEIK